MIVYLSGPMSGKLNHNFPAFHAAAKKWRDLGREVINPAENHGGKTDLPREVYMRTDVELLLKAEAIVMLEGWQESRGACVELAIAVELALLVFDLDGVEQPYSCDIRPVETPINKANTRTVLEEAAHITEGKRREYYGHPHENHGRTAQIWGAYLDRDVTRRDVCMLNVLQKVSRDCNKPVRDNLVDIVGYCRNVEQIQEREG